MLLLFILLLLPPTPDSFTFKIPSNSSIVKGSDGEQQQGLTYVRCMETALVISEVFCLPADYRKDVPPDTSKTHKYTLRLFLR
jgi:hypothetical protein